MKQVTEGTHRACPPAETLARILPVLSRVGITRAADVTWLDRIGIPVYQAIRPNARTLALSQGKGITPELAKVSALMEAIELWHAEEFTPPALQARLGAIAPLLPYDWRQLALYEPHFLHPGTLVEWAEGEELLTGNKTLLPLALLRLDFTARRELALPTFMPSSNGLASGNLYEEAALHALYELVERDALVYWRQAGWPRSRLVDLGTVDSSFCRELLEKFARAEVEVQVFDATGPTGLPCFHAAIYSHDLPDLFTGAGCHLDPSVALSRALTEAAQVRLTVVAGARDDLGDPAYTWARGLVTGRGHSLQAVTGTRNFNATAPIDTVTLRGDLQLVASLVHQQTGVAPIVVDLTRPDLNIPVVFAVAPGLRVGGGH